MSKSRCFHCFFTKSQNRAVLDKTGQQFPIKIHFLASMWPLFREFGPFSWPLFWAVNNLCFSHFPGLRTRVPVNTLPSEPITQEMTKKCQNGCFSRFSWKIMKSGRFLTLFLTRKPWRKHLWPKLRKWRISEPLENPKNDQNPCFFGFYRLKPWAKQQGDVEKWQNGSEQWLRVGVLQRIIGYFPVKNLQFGVFGFIGKTENSGLLGKTKGSFSGQIWKSQQS